MLDKFVMEFSNYHLINYHLITYVYILESIYILR